MASNDSRAYLYRTNRFLSTEPENTIHATLTYPNPAHNTVTLDFSLETPCITETKIIDLSGNTVEEIAKELLNAGTHTYTIDLSELPNGTYFIKIISGSSVSTQKFVKNN
jgi:hypothetical protein